MPQPLSITLKGITNDSLDPSIDVWRTVTFPLLRKLEGSEALDALSIKVLRRGSPPKVWLALQESKKFGGPWLRSCLLLSLHAMRPQPFQSNWCAAIESKHNEQPAPEAAPTAPPSAADVQ